MRETTNVSDSIEASRTEKERSVTLKERKREEKKRKERDAKRESRYVLGLVEQGWRTREGEEGEKCIRVRLIDEAGRKREKKKPLR